VQWAATFLYNGRREGSGARRLAGTILRKLVERTDLSVGQKYEAATLLYSWNPERSEERLFATSVMITLLSHVERSGIKSDVYDMLRSMVPQFHKLPLVEGRFQS
jgi:hypothetical protein